MIERSFCSVELILSTGWFPQFNPETVPFPQVAEVPRTMTAPMKRTPASVPWEAPSDPNRVHSMIMLEAVEVKGECSLGLHDSSLKTLRDLYLNTAISARAVSTVLIREEDKVWWPIYYVNKALLDAETLKHEIK